MPYRTSRCFSALGALVLVLLLRPARADAATVGFVRMTVPGNTASRGDVSGRLRVIVWYPARDGTPVAPITAGPPRFPLFSEGEAAENAPLAPGTGRLPFVVVSHGTGGTALDVSWLCAGLAASGYLVASVDHPGNNAIDPPSVAGLTLWWQRADDLSRVIDGVSADATFGPHVDAARIGAAGYSLGGYTVLALAGATSDPRRLDAYCASHPTTAVCSGVATPQMPDIAARAHALLASDPVYAAEAAQNLRSHRDARVKAVFSIAPALGPAIVYESLAAIAIPVAFVAGFDDTIVPVVDNVEPIALGLPNARLTLLPKPAGHYTFLTDCTRTGRDELADVCADSGALRLQTHAAALSLARGFFDRTLSK